MKKMGTLKLRTEFLIKEIGSQFKKKFPLNESKKLMHS